MKRVTTIRGRILRTDDIKKKYNKDQKLFNNKSKREKKIHGLTYPFYLHLLLYSTY